MDGKINEEQFEALWQRAEADGYAKRLASEYPSWRAHRRRMAGFAILFVAVAGTAIPFLKNPKMEPDNKNYLMAYCNRDDISAQYWVDMADELLIGM
jgi:hypothetical protein